MKLYPTFDPNTTQIVLTQFDIKQKIYFDPITQKEYDVPYVFEDDEDMAMKLPTLIKNIIYTSQTRIQQLEQYKANLSAALIINTLYSNKLYYYINHTNLTVQAATKQGGSYYDIQTNLILPVQTYYVDMPQAYEVLYPSVHKLRNMLKPIPNKFVWVPNKHHLED